MPEEHDTVLRGPIMLAGADDEVGAARLFTL